MQSETAPVREGEHLPVQALSAYLKERLPGVADEVTVEQFPGGHSNLTYLLRCGGNEWVLRRPPFGPVAPKAHDMAREFRVLRAVHPSFPLAPRPFLLCEDASVIGAVFFVMERRKGIVVRSQVPDCFAEMKHFPSHASCAAVDTLAALHDVDVRGEGLAELGKPEGFVGRQVNGWADRWYRARTEEAPQMDRVIRWLSENVPPSLKPTLVHNDFKLDNLMLDPNDPGRVVAVLDWEMTTIGDPLVDLGLTLTYWAPPEGPALNTGPVPAITTMAGWYTREQFLDHYAKATGRDLTHIGFHEVLGIFKLAVIVQQIYQRFVKGQTRDERFSQFYLRVRSLTEAAARRIEEQQVQR